MNDTSKETETLRRQVAKLQKEVNALIDSCWYRTKARKVCWRQGKHFGVSEADYTSADAFLEAIHAIRYNAGISPDTETIDEAFA